MSSFAEGANSEQTNRSLLVGPATPANSTRLETTVVRSPSNMSGGPPLG